MSHPRISVTSNTVFPSNLHPVLMTQVIYKLMQEKVIPVGTFSCNNVREIFQYCICQTSNLSVRNQW